MGRKQTLGAKEEWEGNKLRKLCERRKNGKETNCEPTKEEPYD